MQSNIFIVSTACLFKSFCIFLDKDFKKKVSTHGRLVTVFISPSQRIGNEQLFKIGLMGRKFCNFACCRLLENIISDI